MNTYLTTKLVIIVIVFIICRISTDIFINSFDSEQIIDIFHMNMPDLSNNKFIEFIYHIYSFIPILLLLYNIIRSKKWNIGVKALIFMLFVNILRCFFYSTTILPNSTPCTRVSNTMFDNILNFILGSCRDMIFSGHIVNSYIPLKFTMEFFGLNPIFTIVYQAILAILMLLQRFHYSIDILVAYVMANYLYLYKEHIIQFIINL